MTKFLAMFGAGIIVFWIGLELLYLVLRGA